ncbi:DNA-binding protein [Thermococcus waiotapuensis]|uniref:DNA-binding protein n=1 Tax=Thermococcus waiotapuensis TaxID=90909 RepID=A0AAE4NX76_9EURY|nr:DNA-binding protein [Thermococcus waiotapuensis]MDV3104071.1 DNA-binding protein [Thermococcus waiotapuensis]
MQNQVLEWLQTGRDDAEDIVDLPWSVKQVGENHYVAEHPKIPFMLNVLFMDGFVRLVVPSGIETIAMELGDRVKTYHTLLVLNERMNMLKFTLSGMNDEITLRVDLDEKSLGKEEFNDALTALLVGMNVLMDALGLTEEFQEAIFERLSMMIIERIQKGASEREIIDFLTRKVGMPESEARTLLSEIKKAMKGDDRGYF